MNSPIRAFFSYTVAQAIDKYLTIPLPNKCIGAFNYVKIRKLQVRMIPADMGRQFKKRMVIMNVLF